ncbi:AB-hydrolase YheT [Trametes versicolor FP-101664 SS1]|uniref:AB-hydrolase YheT n=1 Tax=Trametes versicolor (strain FP-101664) TaxID=717944 RepID=UPI00046231A6|nr:AB-hydrolase YheT [Trametes versicolor FP-101664 SS1]EIW60478.1 AB-hydrolase YheT [Trametes versicolor FP-101664 SS1]
MGVFFSLLSAAYYMPKLHFGSVPATIATKSAASSKAIERITLRDFVQLRCPSLFEEFRPAWWLKSGHLQTGYCVLGDFSKIDKVEYDRTLLRTLDGGTIGIDSTPPAQERTLKEDTPIIVVLHGLTGGSHESYVRSILAPACTPVEQGGLGYRGIVVNFRGCAGVPLTSPQLYSALYTDDIRVAVMYIHKQYPRAPLIGIGFSLGANVLTRYLAEEGEKSRLVAGCALACPWDLVASSDHLSSRFFHRHVYSSGMAQNLQKLMERHSKALSKFPDSPAWRAAQAVAAKKSMSLIEFDDTVTCVCGGSYPPFPFATAYDYYHAASSHRVLGGIRVPFLALNSDDDPIASNMPIGEADNGFVVLGLTKGGGHLGWFEAGKHFGQVDRWIRKPVLEWIRAMGQDFVPEGERGQPTHQVDGFLKEIGRDDIGCKEIEGGGHIVGVEGEEGLLAGL